MVLEPAADERNHTDAAPRLFYWDGRDVDQSAVIGDELRRLAALQDADRVAVRCIRALRDANGAPLLGERGEQRRAILAGVVDRDHIAEIAEQIAELNSRALDDPRDSLGIDGAHGGWDCYANAQRVCAPVNNCLLRGALGTVRTEGINAYTTLISDNDPRLGAAPGLAISLADTQRTVLAEFGIPFGAMQIMQSGRGSYLQIFTEPQPLSVRETMRLATRQLAHLIAVTGEPVHGDESVFDPPRILRIPGTQNHKPDADPTTPCWTLARATPGVRAPWALIERLAHKARPKLRVVPITRATADSASAPRRPLLELFRDRGALYRVRPDGVADVRCPNATQHTDGRDGAILYPPTKPGGPGWLKCSHAHCADLDLFTVFRLLERA